MLFSLKSKCVVVAVATISILSAVNIAQAGNGTPTDRSSKPIDLAIIGDVPYGADAIAAFPTLVDAINKDAKVRTVVHVGDIKAGSAECTDEWFWQVHWLFYSFKDPLIYTPGDNEWTDCHRANNGGFDPIDRLDKIREIFFDVPGTTLGGQKKSVAAQNGFPENQLWMESSVAFSALHVVGSNNNLVPWFGADETADQMTRRLAEYNARNSANIAWLDQTFALAAIEDAAGVVLFLHADMASQVGEGVNGHLEFVQRLAELSENFGKPVLLISGDSHDFRVDAGVQWFEQYGVSPVATVTQIIVDRSIEDDSVWLRLRVDPKSEDVFSWEEVSIN